MKKIFILLVFVLLFFLYFITDDEKFSFNMEQCLNDELCKDSYCIWSWEKVKEAEIICWEKQRKYSKQYTIEKGVNTSSRIWLKHVLIKAIKTIL